MIDSTDNVQNWYILQALNTLTQESADDEKVEENPWAIRYPDRAPGEK